MSHDPAPPPDATRDRYGDPDVTVDAHEDDWAWRRRIRANPHTHRIYRILVGVLGLVVVSGGAVMVPFPGPGWLVVFIGVGIWASEFEWAARLLDFGKRTLKAWNAWPQIQPRGMAIQRRLRNAQNSNHDAFAASGARHADAGHP